jgi:hypothetical protein
VLLFWCVDAETSPWNWIQRPQKVRPSSAIMQPCAFFTPMPPHSPSSLLNGVMFWFSCPLLRFGGPQGKRLTQRQAFATARGQDSLRSGLALAILSFDPAPTWMITSASNLFVGFAPAVPFQSVKSNIRVCSVGASRRPAPQLPDRGRVGVPSSMSAWVSRRRNRLDELTWARVIRRQ